MNAPVDLPEALHALDASTRGATGAGAGHAGPGRHDDAAGAGAGASANAATPAATGAGLWRPWSAPGQPAGLRLVRGQGSRVVDDRGRSYLDAAGGLWNVALGLRHEALLARMGAQLQTLSTCALFHASTPPAEQLAAALAQRAGPVGHSVYLSTTGSTAVELALRVARLHHRARGRPQRQGIVSLDQSYHGASLLGLNAGGLVQAELRASGEQLPGFWHLPSPPHEAASLGALRQLLEHEGKRIACLLVEPVLGSAGVRVPSRTYCAELNLLCQAHGVLLVADEVATGAGRCGRFLASQALGLAPDIVTLSKGLNSGYFPLGATLMSRAVVEPIARRGWPLAFGSTQDGNPVGCVAALATLQQIDTQGLQARAEALGAALQQQLRQRLPPQRLREVRGLGLMLGIELQHDDGRPWGPDDAARARALCQEEGLLVYHFDAGLSLFPPLTLGDDEAADTVDILADVLGRLD